MTHWVILRPGNIGLNMKSWKTLIIRVTNLGRFTPGYWCNMQVRHSKIYTKDPLRHNLTGYDNARPVLA